MTCPFCREPMDARGHFRMCLACGVEMGMETGSGWKRWTWQDARVRPHRPKGWLPVPEGSLLAAGRETEDP